MKAMVLTKESRVEEGSRPLEPSDLPDPAPAANEILVSVSVCGVCHTEIDEIEGRTPPARFPVVLGHQVVGRVEGVGEQAHRFDVGDRVGVAWIHSACGKCKFCLSGRENLCPEFRATGRDANGGYAERMTAPEDFAYPIPPEIQDEHAAPLLCAGAIGYRSLQLTNSPNGGRLGLTGFGASGHLVLKMVRFRLPDTEVYVFARSEGERAFARELGAVWAGDSADEPPEKLDAIIDTTPVWKPVVEALRHLEPGGRLVVNAIRKEDADKDYLLKLDYPRDLWLEKEMKSVANVTRGDVSECLELAARMKMQPDVQEYRLEDANEALLGLKSGNIRGAKVLRIR